MRMTRSVIGRTLITSAWLGSLALALRVGLTAYDLNPEHFLALIITTYLGLWGLFFFRSTGSRNGDAARFAACTASVLAVVGFLEAPSILSIIDYRVTFATPSPPWKRPGQHPDRELLYVRDGGQRLRRSFEGNELGRLRGAVRWQTYRCDFAYDRRGFRNSDDRTTAEVIVLGDSLIEGLHVSEADLVTTNLARALRCPVANLARTGDGPQQELEVLRRYGLPLGPSTCLWAFYEGNDLDDADRYEENQKHVAQAARENPSRQLYARSLSRNLLAYVIRTWIHPEPRQPARRTTGWFLDAAGAQLPIYFGSDVRRDSSSPEEAAIRESSGLKRFRKTLVAARELCAQNKIELVVVFIPTKFRVYRDLCAFDPDSPCPAWSVDELPAAVGELVSEVSDEIGYLDLSEGFRKAASQGELLYLPDDTHWTSEGHRLSAHAIAEYLRHRHSSVHPPVARTSAPRP